mgnify:FL=1
MKKKEKVEKKIGETLANTIKDIRAKFGHDAIMMLNEKPNIDVEAISTGSIGLNHAIGIGGLPRGRIAEVYGSESSGKTTLALHIIAEAQKTGGICAFIDAEHAMDPQYAKRLGVETDKLLISQPTSGEEALRIVDSLVRTKKLSVVVIDSVAALTPKAEIDGEIGSVLMGAQARLMSQAMRMLTSSIAKSNTLILFINQTRMNIGGYGDPVTTAGGKALKFYASVRIEVKKIATIKKGEEAIGSRVRAKVVKNKVAAPFGMCEFDIVYNYGIVREAEILILAEKYQIIKKEGASYKWDDVKLGRGIESTTEFLKSNPEITSELVSKIYENQEKEIC